MQDNFAKYISYIFEPFTLSFFSLLMIVNVTNLSTNQKIFWLIAGVLLMGMPPMLVYFYEKKVGKITDWFITNRAERKDVHLAWFLGSLVFSAFAFALAAPKLIFLFSLIVLSLSLVVALINLYWKISVHMVGVTLFVMIALLAVSFDFLFLSPLIMLVGWARLRLQAHTFFQAMGGVVLTVLIVYFFLALS